MNKEDNKEQKKNSPIGIAILLIEIIIVIAAVVTTYLHYYKKVPICSGNQNLNFEDGSCTNCPTDTHRTGLGVDTSVAGCKCLNNKFLYSNGECSCKPGYEQVVKTFFYQNGSHSVYKDCMIGCKGNSNYENVGGEEANTVDCRCPANKIYDTIRESCFDPFVAGEVQRILYPINIILMRSVYSAWDPTAISTINFRSEPHRSDIQFTGIQNVFPVGQFQLEYMVFQFSERCKILSIENNIKKDVTSNYTTFTLPAHYNRVYEPTESVVTLSQLDRIGYPTLYTAGNNFNSVKITCIFPYNTVGIKKYIFAKIKVAGLPVRTVIFDALQTNATVLRLEFIARA